MTVKVLISGQGNPIKEILKKVISNNEPVEIVMEDTTKEKLKCVDDYAHTGEMMNNQIDRGK